jgi:hypothetical protein
MNLSSAPPSTKLLFFDLFLFSSLKTVRAQRYTLGNAAIVVGPPSVQMKYLIAAEGVK